MAKRTIAGRMAGKPRSPRQEALALYLLVSRACEQIGEDEAMPPFRKLTQEQVSAIVLHARSLQ